MAPSSFSLRDLLSDQSPSQLFPHRSNVSPSNGHRDQGADEADSPGTAKRRRMTTSDFTRRKRTAVACQFCRVRKTKCDNVRPQCGYCVRQKAKCVYGDMDAEEAEPEPSRPPVSNEQLMGRLDEIQEMLRRTTLSTDPFSSPSTTAASMGPGSSQAATSPQARSTAPFHGNQRAPLPGLRCESILSWPCFAGVIPLGEAGVDSFPLSAKYEETRGIQGDSSQGGRGIREDAFLPLCRKFLAEVHPRNPVLDGLELMRHARRAAEDGLGWDSSSCLVVSRPSLLPFSSLTKASIAPGLRSGGFYQSVGSTPRSVTAPRR